MSKLEKKLLALEILKAYKAQVECVNVFDEDDEYEIFAEEHLRGMETIAACAGYALSAHRLNNLVGNKYDKVTIASEGEVILEMPVC